MIQRIVTALHTFCGQPVVSQQISHSGSPSRLTKRSGQPPLQYDDEDAAREAMAIVEDYTMLSYQRMVTLWQQVRYLDRAGIPGCLVECGTWKGGASAMMALAHCRSGHPQRELHLFDSFQGLPEPDHANDGDLAVRYAGERASGKLRSIGKCAGSLEENKYLMSEIVKYPCALTHYHAGWFQETLRLAQKSIDAIALLRIDGDWYESTRVCLEILVPRVTSGGIVVIDDYGKWPGCRKAVDEFLMKMDRPLFLNHIDAAGRYWIVP